MLSSHFNLTKECLSIIKPPFTQNLGHPHNRSELIHRAIATLNEVFIEQIIIVALVCAVFLMHVRSALVAIIMLPIGVLIAFIAMFHLGINSNIMSLAGIALAIAEMTDAAIVMVENAHKHLARLAPD